jgi:hypothetical protein
VFLAVLFQILRASAEPQPSPRQLDERRFFMLDQNPSIYTAALPAAASSC